MPASKSPDLSILTYIPTIYLMDRFSLPSRLAILHRTSSLPPLPSPLPCLLTKPPVLTRLTTLILTHLILTLTLYLYTAPNFSHPTPLLYVPLIWCLAADTAEILALITRSEDGVPRAPTWAMVVGETLAVGLCSVSWVVSPSASFTPMGEQKWIGRLWVGVACLV